MAIGTDRLTIARYGLRGRDVMRMPNIQPIAAGVGACSQRPRYGIAGQDSNFGVAARATAFLVLVTAFALPVGGQEISSDLEPRVREWVDQLDAASLADRRAAERALLDAGPAALSWLPGSKTGLSPEAVERLDRIRRTLEARRDEAESEAETVVVRLGDVATLGAALEAISRDSGIEFEFSGDRSVSIDATTTPLSFWHAVDLVLDQAQLDINFYGGDRGTLMLVPRRPGRPSRVDSAAYTGIFRIEPTLVTSRRHLTQSELSGLNVSVHLSWEPRRTPIGLTIPVQQLSARLDDDQVLRPQASGEMIEVATNSDIAFAEFYLPFELPAGQPGKITSISGVIEALMPGERQSFELPLADPNATQTIDAMTVSLEEVRETGALHQVRVAIELENPDRSLESHRHWIFENQVFGRLPDESRVDHLGFEVYRQTQSGVGAGYLFDFGGAIDQSTLIYRSPTAVVSREVPFVIQGIPLP